METNPNLTPDGSNPSGNTNKKWLIAILILLGLLISGIAASVFINNDKGNDKPNPTPTYTATETTAPTVIATPTPKPTEEPIFTIQIDGKTYTEQEEVDKAVSSPLWVEPVIVCRDIKGYNLFFTSAEKASGDKCVPYIKEPTQEQINALTTPTSGGTEVFQGAYPFSENLKMMKRSEYKGIEGTDKLFYYEAMSDYQTYVFTKKSHAAIGMGDYPNMTVEDGIAITDNPIGDVTKENGWTIYAKYGNPAMTPSQKEEYRKGWEYGKSVLG